MGKFDEFDLDLQSIKSGEDTSQSKAVTYNCTTATINSIAYCTKNGQWNSCMCSTCCGGHTVPVGCSRTC